MANNELAHWGIKGMRWGIRRYQNKDGSLTPAGKKRYNEEMERAENERKELNRKQRTNAKIRKLNALKDANAELKKRLQEESDALDPKKVAAKEKAEAKAEKKARKLIEKAEKAELKKLKKAEEEAKKFEDEQRKKANDDSWRHKRIEDMTEDELYRAAERTRLENIYLDQRASKPISQGKAFVLEIAKKNLIPMVTDTGKAVATDILKGILQKKLGISNNNNNNNNNNKKDDD